MITIRWCSFTVAMITVFALMFTPRSTASALLALIFFVFFVAFCVTFTDVAGAVRAASARFRHTITRRHPAGRATNQETHR